jgi:hypothetical protein
MNVKANSQIARQLAKLERHTRHESLAAQGYKRPDTPVSLIIHSVRPRRIDVANTSDKAATDGLVRSGILFDDGPNQIEKVTFTQETGQIPETIITMEW